MIFMVHIDAHFPATLAPEDMAKVRKDETEAAMNFMSQGNLLRIWRLPASMSSRAIWSFDTTEELDTAVKSLPAFPYFTAVLITPLIEHPSAKAFKDKYGAMPEA
jgi:muconolactone delta-isomerase